MLLSIFGVLRESFFVEKEGGAIDAYRKKY